MVLKSKFTISLLAASVLFACGDDDGSSAADAGPEPTFDAAPANVTLDDICAEDGLFVAFIDKFETCMPELAAFAGGFPEASTIAQICEDGNAPYLADGSLVLGPLSLMAPCMAALEAADCIDFDLDFIEECEGLLQGTVEASGECDNNDVCADSLYCDQSGTGDCGFCAALKPEGNACETGDECLDGVCVDGTCTGDGLAGSACLDSDNCRGRLVCDVVTSVCTSPESYQVDDPCVDFEGQCGFPFSAMYCNAAAQGGGKCESFRALGEACDPQAGELCDIFKGEACDTETTQTCIAATVQADGEACDIIAGTTCMSGSLCNTGDSGSAGVCEAFVADGGSCEEDAEVGCAFLLECVGGTCQAGKHTGLCSE
tara:strand:+ start:55900 stop:57018 length:1119 start_codon:yes stop_codon:yes gene_type:complete